MLTIKQLKEWLSNQIFSYQNIAEEYIQEIGNQEECDIQSAKAEAMQEVLNFIKANE